MFSASHWELAQNGDIKARNDIIVEYQQLVDYCASRLSQKLPRHVDFSDLKASGQFGLIDAIMKFEPERGFKFETYAIPRIRGAIIDNLRTLDWVPRSVRFKERKIETASEKMTMLLGREPTENELADELEMDLDTFRSARFASENSYIWNIDTPIDPENDQTLADLITCNVSAIGDEQVTVDIGIVLETIDLLQEKERATLNMHYYLGYTLAEIGRRFGVTESRVCQIHTRALKRLRKALLEDSFV